MAKGYWIGHIDVADAEPYKAYIPAATEAVTAFGGRFLARGGRAELGEGSARSRHVIIEFPSYEQAIECYRSVEYTNARALRTPYSTGDVIIVEGIP